MAIGKGKIALISVFVIAIVGVVAVFIAIVLFLVFAWAVVHVTTAPSIEFSKEDSQSVRVEKTEAWLEKLHQQGSFNGAVLVAKEGQVIFSKCLGYTDASKKAEIKPQTSMRLASVSKQFTAAAILVLAEQGKVGLDDPVAAHLNEFPFDDVTIRHLLNMTSGVPDCYMDLAQSHRDEIADCLTNSDVARLIARFPPERVAKVNVKHKYSNTSYVLLATIVESVSGESFEAFMSKEIFQPLGMQNTRVWNQMSDDETFAGKAGSFLDGEDQKPGFLDGVAGDGSVFCSLDDFEIWDQFWRGNDLVSAELMNQAFERPQLADGSKSDYGFGWVVQSEKDWSHWHNGGWLGARTYVYQDKDCCIVILDNSSSLIVDSMGSELHRALDD